MKFSSFAVLAVAATPFLSLVSASGSVSRKLILETYDDITDVLTAECAATPTTMSAKGKGGGKGGSSTCTGTWLAADITTPGGPTTFTATTVVNACTLIPGNGPVVDIGDFVVTLAPATSSYTGFLSIDDDTIFPFPVEIDIAGSSNQDYVNFVKAECKFDVPTNFVDPRDTDAVPPSRIVSLSNPIQSALVVPFGALTIGTAPAPVKTYAILYTYLCEGELDDTNLSPAVADFLEAYDSRGEDCLADGGKKGSPAAEPGTGGKKSGR